jgi:sucrose-6F-phosphate phosphohydrolase
MIRLLATDLDNTLVGDQAALAAFNHWFAGVRHRWRLVYLTGRGLPSAWDLIGQAHLLLPDALVTDVGTDIHLARQYPPTPLDYQQDSQWAVSLAAEWDGSRVEETVGDVPGVSLQPHGRRPLRRGYTVSGKAAAVAAETALAEQGLPVRTVFSSNRDLDVLPRHGGKGSALRRLVGQWGMQALDVLVCGDSGNDMDMLDAGYRGVVVANAQPELLRRPLPDSVHRAFRPFAWGVLEGISHHFGHV